MPNKFTPINSKGDVKSALQSINNNFMMLDQEVYTKNIENGGKKKMSSGKLRNGKYGEVFYDDTNIARIYIGQAPRNGRPGIWISKPGFNVEDIIR